MPKLDPPTLNVRDKFIEQLSYRIESKGSVLISSQVRALAEMVADILTCEIDDRITSVILDKIDPRNKPELKGDQQDVAFDVLVGSMNQI